jgi:hypothetical protein
MSELLLEKALELVELLFEIDFEIDLIADNLEKSGECVAVVLEFFFLPDLLFE